MECHTEWDHSSHPSPGTRLALVEVHSDDRLAGAPGRHFTVGQPVDNSFFPAARSVSLTSQPSQNHA